MNPLELLIDLIGALAMLAEDVLGWLLGTWVAPSGRTSARLT